MYYFKEGPWTSLNPWGFMDILALLDFLIRNFLAMWAFLAPDHMGQGQVL